MLLATVIIDINRDKVLDSPWFW